MAENPQTDTSLVGGSTDSEIILRTDSGAAETMAENATQLPGSAATENAGTSGQACKRQARVLDIMDLDQEMKRLATKAATEYYMNLETTNALSLAELQSKHGMAHHTTLVRAIKKMSADARSFALAHEFQHSE